MNLELNEEKIKKIMKDIEKNKLKLKILMGGKCGAGKSSVLNTLIGECVSSVSEGNLPCTGKNIEYTWETEVGNLVFVDVPGFGEANAPDIGNLDYINNIKFLAQDAHLFLMVLDCTDRALEKEALFLNNWNDDETLSKIPTFIVVNKIDSMKPSGDRDLTNLNLINPQSRKEKNIKEYLDYISRLPAFVKYAQSNRIIPFAAGEYQDSPKYGIEQLKDKIFSQIPSSLQIFLERTKLSKDQKADRIIQIYSVSCAGLAVEPIPVVDSLIIAPVQITMVIQLGKIYEVNLSKSAITGIANTVLLSFGGTYLFLSLTKLVPGWGSVIGPGIAYGLTISAGKIIKELFSQGNFNPTPSEMKKLAEKYKELGKRAGQEYQEKL